MSKPAPEHYNGYTITYTRVENETESDADFVIEWTVDDEDGMLMGAGYCATEADARNDAQAFIGKLIEESKQLTAQLMRKTRR